MNHAPSCNIPAIACTEKSIDVSICRGLQLFMHAITMHYSDPTPSMLNIQVIRKKYVERKSDLPHVGIRNCEDHEISKEGQP